MRRKTGKTVERAKYIQGAVLEGQGTAEISGDIGISVSRVKAIASNFCIDLPNPQQKRFGFHTSRKRAAMIKAISDRVGIPPSSVCHLIVASVLDDGLERAIKRMGKPAKLTRRT